MKINAILWLPEIVEKLEIKLGVGTEEVAEVFGSRALYRRGARGQRRGEDLYKAYGRTEAGRYLFVVFIYKRNRRALILSARDMSETESRLYRSHRR